MVTIQKTELKEGILKGIEKAKKTSASILVSDVQKIESIEPLSFFAAGFNKYHGERFFWKHPSEEFYLIGLGICKRMVTDQEADRFFHVEKEWNRLIEKAIIQTTENTQGTGPTAFGCLSFDPLKEKTKLWSNFDDSIFHVPKYMLTVKDHQVYLTTNVICSDQDDSTMIDKIEMEMKEIVEASVTYRLPVENHLLVKRIDINPEKWKQAVDKVAHDLQNNPSLKKVVLARELRLIFNKRIVIEKVLNSLLKDQHNSFIFAFESNGDCFMGATPERLVKKEGDQVFSACLAGSIARGKSEKEDLQLGNTLLDDKKNRIEHQYVVDMIREAMNDTCSKVCIPESPQLFKLKHIQHLYTPVVGKVNPNTSLLDLVKRLHPTPALGGLPKNEALIKIREVEELDRGFFGGPIGWFDHKGNGDFSVAIRSGLIQGNEASIFAGCGVVEDSESESEFEETNIKFKPMLSALGG
ncbi:isochorismate synthase [Niallia sp. Krafla_26]|uniref:isochorismate synthase n=1 Tax=Niallia sp. Krafla_26 TaxID=3064703 RepID=UPI003D17633E